MLLSSLQMDTPSILCLLPPVPTSSTTFLPSLVLLLHTTPHYDYCPALHPPPRLRQIHFMLLLLLHPYRRFSRSHHCSPPPLSSVFDELELNALSRTLT